MVEEEGGEEEEMIGMVWVGKLGREVKYLFIYWEVRLVCNVFLICYYFILLRCFEIMGDSWWLLVDFGIGIWR